MSRSGVRISSPALRSLTRGNIHDVRSAALAQRLKDLDRPGIARVLERIIAGDADGLIVS
jgi:hypothetical protein